MTIAGGKWTTYRRMAEDCVDQAATLAHLEERPCATADLKIHGYYRDADALGHLSVHGSDAAAVCALGDARLHRALVHLRRGDWAVRQEMARTVEDAACARVF